MHRALPALLPALLLTCVPVAWAEPSAEPAARLAVAVGPVEYLGPETDAYQPAPVNLALQPGDRLRTGAEARAEVQFEGGAVVRLGADSEAEILAVGRSPVVRLLEGRAHGRGPRVPNESLTLEAGLRIVGAADGSAFRVTRRADEPRAEVAATTGTIAVETEGERVELARGSQLAAGERTRPSAAVLVRDDFDRWNAERDAVLARAAVGSYAPSHLPGLGDLDASGSWVRTEEYGYAWRPHVAVGWRPFTRGRWIYRPYYGWVWLAAEPWGYTTYYYGRWVPSGLYGWIWIPGPRFVISVGLPHSPPPPVVVRPPVVVVPPPVHVVRPPVVVTPPVIVKRPVHVHPPVVVHPHPPKVIRRQPLPARPPAVIERPVTPPPRRQPVVVERPAVPRAPRVVQPSPRVVQPAPRVVQPRAARPAPRVIQQAPARPSAPPAVAYRRQPLPR
ncbi:MAG TPA: FecR family protein [Thermodesulfobacteriota bacterium]